MYDALNRETFKDIPGGTSADVTSRYDLSGRRTFARFGATLTPSSDCTANNEGVDYCYDTAGGLSAETSYGRRLQFQYDQASNRTGIVYHTPAAAALTVNYTYDALNRVDQIGENGVPRGRHCRMVAKAHKRGDGTLPLGVPSPLDKSLM